MVARRADLTAAQMVAMMAVHLVDHSAEKTVARMADWKAALRADCWAGYSVVRSVVLSAGYWVGR